ncbi:hypothetical protein [Treponema sp.]|uniref:hypothetical protein n=1 Tax=Treponema sp. TaxID=166 RepID=UPI0025F68F82|nr:hypothetical protein [Treponema sp.]MBR4323104.1 hypothetical protein [Treponema sp.]
MSDVAFAELETQVETLPMFQIVMLKEKIDRIVAQRQKNEFEFDCLVRHTDRADFADEYIRDLRDNDRF